MKKIGKTLAIILLFCMVLGLLSPLKESITSSGPIFGTVSQNKPDTEIDNASKPKIPTDDIRNKTYVMTSSSYFQGNEMPGLVWKQYNLTDTRLTHEVSNKDENNKEIFDGVLISEKNAFTYQVPLITNRLTDQIEFPGISYWDVNEFFAYDFSISTTSEFPNGIAFTLLSSDMYGNYDLTGEKLYIERINGKDTLFKSCCFVYWEETPLPEEDWEVPGVPEYRYDKAMKVENMEIGTMQADAEYQFTFLIECDRSTFGDSNPFEGHSVYATYAYVYLNGEFLTTLGFNVNENSTQEQGWDVEYSLGIMFDTRYKTVNPGSNMTLTNLLTAGTKAGEYYDGMNYLPTSNYYIADLFSKENRYAPLSCNPDWYYSDAVYQSDISSSSILNTEISYNTQSYDDYNFIDDTISGISSTVNLEDYFEEPFVENNRNYRCYDTSTFWYLGTSSIYMFSWDFYHSSVPSSRVEIFLNGANDTCSRMYLVPKTANGTSYLQLAFEKNGQMRYYGYFEQGKTYTLSFAIQVDGTTHFYVNGKWLTSIDGFINRDNFYLDGEYKVSGFYVSCDENDSIWDLEFSNILLTKYDETKITSSDTFIEYVFTNPLAYLYYNPDWDYFYNLSM